MIVYTESQWRELDDSKKGRITHEYASKGRTPRYKGSKTLMAQRRMLVEGIDFRIDYSLI